MQVAHSDKPIKLYSLDVIISVRYRDTKALNLLNHYDHKTLAKPKGHKNIKIITYKNCLNIIQLLKFNEERPLFAKEIKA